MSAVDFEPVGVGSALNCCTAYSTTRRVLKSCTVESIDFGNSVCSIVGLGFRVGVAERFGVSYVVGSPFRAVGVAGEGFQG